jgi:hypothetical protein
VAGSRGDRGVSTWSTITWDTARAGGFAAYVLLSLAVIAGLVLRNRWQSERWPRLVTNELHGYLSLLGLVFVSIHVLAVTIDPFTHFGLGAVLIPFASHYRPLWMSLGIVALYLLLAVWITTRLRSRIGYSLWRRIHLLAFAVFAASTIHGLGTGSDTKTRWALAIYVVAATAVGALSARRLIVPVGREEARHPVAAALPGLALLGTALWALAGPLAPHWGSRAGGTPRAAAAVLASQRTRTPQVSAVPGAVQAPFVATFSGVVSVSENGGDGFVTVRIHGALRGGTRDHLEILVHGVPLSGGGVAMQASHVALGTTTPLYTGRIVRLDGMRLVAAVASDSERLRLDIALHFQGGRATGTVRGTAGGGLA